MRVPSTVAVSAPRRWGALWHGFFYVLLAYGTVAALYGKPVTLGHLLPPLALVLALGGWYGYWQVWRPVAQHAALWYLVGAICLWVALIALGGSFVILGLAVFAPQCLHDLRLGSVVLVVVIAGWLWQLSTHHDPVPWLAVAGVVVLTAGVLLSVGYMGTVVRQSRERQRLIDELEATRAGLAAAERLAGTLEERGRLARDIHDTLTQGFVSIVMLLEAAQRVLGTHEASRYVGQALRAARENLGESRRLVWALRPQTLDSMSLPRAIEGLVHRLSEESKAGGRARCWNCGSLAIAYDRWNTRSRTFGDVGIAFCEICGVWSVM